LYFDALVGLYLFQIDIQQHANLISAPLLRVG
jgi:hypothetical protein